VWGGGRQEGRRNEMVLSVVPRWAFRGRKISVPTLCVRKTQLLLLPYQHSFCCCLSTGDGGGGEGDFSDTFGFHVVCVGPAPLLGHLGTE
jgi:hypothetical protein